MELTKALEDVFTKETYLPIRRDDNSDFYQAVYTLLHNYQERIEDTKFFSDELRNDIRFVCHQVCLAITQTYQGQPYKAYDAIDKALNVLVVKYNNWLTYEDIKDPPLYRAVGVDNKASYDCKRIFHVPYSLRSKMSTQRYSIPGYPSLYLGTSLKLNCLEIGKDPNHDNVIASLFMPYDWYSHHKNVAPFACQIRALDFSIKPQDIITWNNTTNDSDDKDKHKSRFDNKQNNYTSYFAWYPLIAASSFIRIYPDDPYAVEYIIPQIIMQWLINYKPILYDDSNLSVAERYTINGIKYFSCKSKLASEMGLNYAFPSTGYCISVLGNKKDYCPLLSTNFQLTPPVYISEYESIEVCEKALIDMENQLTVIGIKKAKYSINKEGKCDYPEDSLIPAYAFFQYQSLRSIEIPDSVTSIGDLSFYGCSKLNNLHIPDSVISIGTKAFFNCTELREVSIPDSVMHIGKYAFFGCDKLQNVTLPSKDITIDENAFPEGCNIKYRNME